MFPLDKVCRKAWKEGFEAQGGKVILETQKEKTLQRVQLDEAKRLTDHYRKNAAKIQTKVEELKIGEAKRLGQELLISERYEKILAQKWELGGSVQGET